MVKPTDASSGRRQILVAFERTTGCDNCFGGQHGMGNGTAHAVPRLVQQGMEVEVVGLTTPTCAHGKHRVTVEHRVHGTNCSGESIVPDSGQLLATSLG